MPLVDKPWLLEKNQLGVTEDQLLSTQSIKAFWLLRTIPGVPVGALQEGPCEENVDLYAQRFRTSCMRPVLKPHQCLAPLQQLLCFIHTCISALKHFQHVP